jgi:hypothetical protein
MKNMTRVVVTCFALLAVGCASNGAKQAAPLSSARTPAYTAKIDPTKFTTNITNRYMPLHPGTTLTFEATKEGVTESTLVTVTRDTATIMGVKAVTVHDVVRTGGKVTEDTYDWYAQDADGNVWYMGEDTKKYDNGKLSTEGSWRGGVNEAQPGIIMEAQPKVGDHYRQEYLKGHAEDEATVVQTHGTLKVGTKTYTDVLATDENTRLEPDVVERKFYAPGVGFIYLKTLKGPAEVQRLTGMGTA